MNNQLRLILDEPMSGSLNMGIDSAIVQSVAAGESLPTLRLYSWISPAVTVGYFQKVSETVNTHYCRENNINVIRRITGGGTVLHHKEITYSFVVPISNSFLPKDLISSFKAIIDPIIEALIKTGIDAVFKPVNDIIVNNKKISGSAQTRKHGVILQPGTILTKIDKNMFEGALKFNRVKLSEKGVSEPFELVTSVKNILGSEFRENTPDIIIESIIDSFIDYFQLDCIKDCLSDKEILIAEKNIKEIFEDREWNFKR